MNTSLNTSVNLNSSITSRTPSPTKKPKQMTLFDIGSKGKFSLSCSTNRVLSPQFKRDEKSLKRSKSIEFKNNENAAVVEDKENNMDCDVIDLCESPKKAETKKVKKTKVDKENKENSSEAPKKEVKKRSSVKKEPTKIDTVPLVKTIVKELKKVESSEVVIVEADEDKDAPTITETPEVTETATAAAAEEVKPEAQKSEEMETDDGVNIIDVSKSPNKAVKEEVTKTPKSNAKSPKVKSESPSKTAEKKTAKQTNLSGFFKVSADSNERYVIPKMDPVVKVTKLPAEPKSSKSELKSMPIDYMLLEKQVTETGQLIYEEDGELENYMFGEIIEAVQLYNCLVSLYAHNSFNLVAKKKSKWAKKEVVPEHLRLDETTLEYEAFLKMIRADCTSQDKSAYCELVKNLLRILFQHESLYDKTKILGLALKDISLHDCFLQELCKIVESSNFSEDSVTEEELLIPSEDKIKKSKLLGLLNSNHSEEPFMNFTAENKIELMKLISSQILIGEKYNNHMEALRGKVDNLQAVVRQLRSELWEKVENPDKDKKKGNLKDALKKTNKTGWLEQLEKKEKQVDAAQLALVRTERFMSLGVDSKDQVYWYFPCFKQLVVEKKTDDVEKSEWYSILPEDVQAILDLTKKCKQDKQFVEKLQKIYDEHLSKELFEIQDDKSQLSDNDTIPDDESQDDADPKGLQRFERRQTRSVARRSCTLTASEALEDMNGMSVSENSDTDEEDLKTLTPEDTNETKDEWLAVINKAFGTKSTYTLDNLLVWIINREGFIYFSGNSYDERYTEFKDTVMKYKTLTTFEEKFQFLKEVLTLASENVLMKARFIHLEAGKKGLWKNLVHQCQSLSGLYLLALVQFYMVNWKILKITACDLCKKRGSRFKKLEKVDEMETFWKEESEFKMGFLICVSCDISSKTRCSHKKCFDEMEHENSTNQIVLQINGNTFRCFSCASKYSYVNGKDVVEEKREDQDAKLAEELADSENRTRKSKKEVNYSETERRPIKVRSSRSSTSSRHSVSSMATSEDEDERGSKSSRGLGRTASKRTAKAMKEEAPPTRSSVRVIAARTVAKRPKYTDELSSDEGASDSE